MNGRPEATATAAAATADPLLEWRAEFPSAEHFTHLLSHSLGAMPRRARTRLAQYLDAWNERNIHAWEEAWWSLPLDVGNVLADILLAPHGSVTMHPSATLAQATVLSALEFGGMRNRIVCTELDFPSMLYLYQGLADRGAQVVRVPSSDGVTVDPARIVEAIDERTAVVAISGILFKTAALVDVGPVIARAHAVGAPVLLDAYQWIGAVPIDVTALGLDFLVGGSVKYLCGGPGAGFLYVRPDLLPRLRPRLTGWIAHTEPFAFDPGPMRYREDGLRLLSGTTHVACLYAASAGYEIVRSIGVETIRAKSLRMTGRIVERALAEGWRVRSPLDSARRGGSVTIDLPDGERIQQELARRRVLCDFRPGAGLRLGPHFYTSDADIDRAFEEIQEITGRRR